MGRGLAGCGSRAAGEVCCEMCYDAVKPEWGGSRVCNRVQGGRWVEVREVYDCCGEVWWYGWEGVVGGCAHGKLKSYVKRTT